MKGDVEFKSTLDNVKPYKSDLLFLGSSVKQCHYKCSGLRKLICPGKKTTSSFMVIKRYL